MSAADTFAARKTTPHTIFMNVLRRSFLLAAFMPVMVQAQLLNYGWPNLGLDPCAEWLSCEEGCTACNTPRGSSSWFTGSEAAWIGVTACPHAKGDGDATVFTTGWTTMPGEAMVVISLVALEALQVDSIVIDHTGTADGCDRLQVRFGVNSGLPETVVRDEALAGEAQRTVITDLGCITPGEGGIGTAQLVLQAYGGGDGWWLDNVHVVTSPCLSTGISAFTVPASQDHRPVRDLLGRPVGRYTAQGIYFDRLGNRVVVLP